MSYKHDIFISYRRNPETHAWIEQHFLPLLVLRLELELGRKPSIYRDNEVEAGTSWPNSIAEALGKSRILVPLWTGNYLSSVWCVEELSHMLARETEAKLRTIKRPYGLVIPVFIHDGEKFPSTLNHIQHFEIQKCFNVRMGRTSARAEELDSALAEQAPAIAACINHAPGWRKAWPRSAAAKFFKQFYREAEIVQTNLPRFTL